MFEHQPHVISIVRLSENKGLVAERLEVWKLPHLLGEGVRPPGADTSPLHLLPGIIEFKTEDSSRSGSDSGFLYYRR